MNSEWFLFKGTHHIGPFTSSEIEVMYKRGDIVRSVLIWKEGEKSWEPLFKVSRFQKLFENEAPEEIKSEPIKTACKIVVNIVESVPDLPPMPSEAPKTKKLPPSLKKGPVEFDREKTVPNLKLSIPDDEVPPPIPMDVFESVPKIQKPTFNKPMFNKKFEGVSGIDYSKWSLGIIAVIFIAIFSWHFLFQTKDEVHFKIRNLMPLYVEKLENTASEMSLSPKVFLALSMDGSTLYMSSNRSKEMDVSIKLTSIPGRILGKSGGVMTFRGKVLDHLGEFNKVYYTNGQDFSPGEYTYEIHVVEKHFINTYFPIFYKLGITKNLNKKYSLKGKELIFASSPRDFELKMNRFLQEEINKQLRPLQEKRERLSTLNSLLDQMMAIFKEVVLSAKTGKDIKPFQDQYMKNISPLLQTMVSKDNSETVSQNELIKEISGLSVELISKVSPLKKIKKEEKEKIISTSKSHSDQIKTHIEQQLNFVNEELKKINH